jgi:adenosylcobinamide kinase / adenosylcobinamide-phosphate guanylyltransferase
MSLLLLIGGARSGKSRLAAEIAAEWSGPVAVIATGEARDEEMAERIRMHRALRPQAWTTIEEPVDLEAALGGVPDEALAVVDCLTLWVSNLIEKGLGDDEIEARARDAASLAGARGGDTVVVTNEVGSGIVPANALARRYRDLLGNVNSIWAGHSDRSALVVAGRILPLSDPSAIWGNDDR